MTVASALQRGVWRHPEAGPAGVVVVAWAALLVLAGAGAGAAAHGHHATPILPPGAHGLLMVLAMMVPGALPAAREVALGALWSRRGRTTSIFLVSYVAAWTVFGVGASALGWLTIRAFGGTPVLLLPALLMASALWQLLPWKQRAIRACHLLPPLPPRGAKADAACSVLALRYARWCIASCWPLMLAMVAAHRSLWLMAAMTGLITAEKVAARPGRIAVSSAAALVVAALVLLTGRLPTA